MTNLDALYKAVDEKDQLTLLKWLEDYALWFDPGGYWDVMETIEYLTSVVDYTIAIEFIREHGLAAEYKEYAEEIKGGQK